MIKSVSGACQCLTTTYDYLKLGHFLKLFIDISVVSGVYSGVSSIITCFH